MMLLSVFQEKRIIYHLKSYLKINFLKACFPIKRTIKKHNSNILIDEQSYILQKKQILLVNFGVIVIVSIIHFDLNVNKFRDLTPR